jgi:hypothetical protein
MTQHPYRVRKQSSGYAFSEKWIVVKLLGGGKVGRVSVHAHASRESAQAAADDLNIMELVKLYDDDPRPFADRHAEATALYRADKATV